jgi:hypothetical protein
VRHPRDRWLALGNERADSTFPENIATHCAVQDFYFGKDFLLRRHDYNVEVSGDLPAAQYVHGYVEADIDYS